MNKVEVKNIYMNYHTKDTYTQALKNISFKVYDGEFLSIVGPSGCGKSTILNIIANLLNPSYGEIFIDDEVTNSISSKIGYMFQKDQLFEWLTVWNNVTLGLKVQNKLTKEAENKINTLIKNYNLSDFKNHHPSQLSGGMRQRVALIRTLAVNPEVLLLDEPFSALDYQTRLKVSDEIYNIIKKEKKTAVMVTHDISEAVSLSDRVIVLSNRPAEIVDIVEIKFSNEYDSPLKRRKSPDFRQYFDTIWEELNKNGIN